MAVSNPDRVVTKQDLANFYGEILPYLGGMPEILANKFSRSDLYSTSEKIVGCWKDGKPIYQKTLIDSMPNVTTAGTGVTKTIDIGASVDVVVDVDVMVNNTTNSVFQKLYSHTTSTSTYARIYVYNNNASSSSIKNKVGIASTSPDWSNKPVYITIRYTKTTDSVNSFKFSTETDYSTDEHIIGTWIDGKPLYQKTIESTMPTISTFGTAVEKTIDIGASVSDIADVKGYIVNTNTTNTRVPFPHYNLNNNKLGATVLTVRPNSYTNTPKNVLAIVASENAYSNCPIIVTIQYTKTTD